MKTLFMLKVLTQENVVQKEEKNDQLPSEIMC